MRLWSPSLETDSLQPSWAPGQADEDSLPQMRPQLPQELPAHVGSPDVVVSQLLQDLHVGLIFEGFSLQCPLKDLVSEFIDRTHPFGGVVTHVLEYRWGLLRKFLQLKGK